MKRADILANNAKRIALSKCNVDIEPELEFKWSWFVSLFQIRSAFYAIDAKMMAMIEKRIRHYGK